MNSDGGLHTVSCQCFVSNIDCHLKPGGIKDLGLTGSINGELFCHSSLCLAADMSQILDEALRAHSLKLSQGDLLREPF